jgi:hypothetical protein
MLTMRAGTGMLRSALRVVAGVAAAGALFCTSSTGHAWCRTTTCDPAQEPCPLDAAGCMTTGKTLFWRGRCISFGVDYQGTPKHGISHDLAQDKIIAAYRAWMSADCGNGTPSLQMFASPEPIRCDHQVYNREPEVANANAWIFLDDQWPYVGQSHQIALTTLTFQDEDGEIFDVDVEINSAQFEISASDEVIKADLESIATHEAGHFFGLSHTQVDGATMEAQYNVGDVSLRTLEADDIEGICTAYPPDRQAAACLSTQTPRHGFSAECSDALETDGGCCTTAPNGNLGAPARAILASAFGILVLFARRRSRLSRAD